jgi:hypothetical protein
MNIETIGTNAGLVWNALNEVEAMTAAQLRKATKLKDKELMLALGWLAREDKLVIADDEDGKSFTVALAR